MTSFRLLVHVVAFTAYLYTVYFDFGLIPVDHLPVKGTRLSKFVWLTMVDLYVQLAYNFWGIFAALGFAGCFKSFHYLARAIVQPIGMTVAILFWALYLFDPHTLVEDNEVAKRILGIVWFNHCLHTLPAVTTVLDELAWNHGQPSRKSALTGIFIFSTLYIIDIHLVHHYSGFWAYPILGMLSPPLRAIFILVCMFVIYLSFSAFSVLHGLVHGHHHHTQEKKKGKKSN